MSSDRGQGGPHRRDERPQRLILGPGRDPRRSFSFCAAVSSLWIDAGGIRSSLSSEKIRWISSLSSGLPGTMAPILTATSRRSNRRSALRAALSGPWQAKQFSARIGRMSRLKLSFGSSAPCAEPARRTSGPAKRDETKQTMIGKLTLRMLVDAQLRKCGRAARRRGSVKPGARRCTSMWPVFCGGGREAGLRLPFEGIEAISL